MADIADGAGFDEFEFAALAFAPGADGSDDRRFAASAPALVALAVFAGVVAAAGECAEVLAVIADDMNIRALSADQFSREIRATAIVFDAVVFLNHDVVRGVFIERAGILRMHVEPGDAQHHEIDFGFFNIVNQQAKRCVIRLAIAQETGDGDAFAIRGKRGKRIEFAGAVIPFPG